MKFNSRRSLRLILVLLFVSLGTIHQQEIDAIGIEESEYEKVCSYLHCKRQEVCVHRRFLCKKPPCPSMLFCAETKRELVRGPATCDSARCSGGHVCFVKVRRCHWDENCEFVARCISLKDYSEAPNSCAGAKCPEGEHCILKESECVNPPCKLARSCERDKDVEIWFSKCRSLGCPSEYECFLRKEQGNCNVSCQYIPSCTTTIEDELRSEYCEGWICPRHQTCSVKIIGDCTTDNCNITRSCEGLSIQPEQSFLFDYAVAEKLSLPQNRNVETNYSTSKEFQEWLESLKAKLGPDMYNLWLDYIRRSENSEFIPIPRSILSLSPRTSLNIEGNTSEADSVIRTLSVSEQVQHLDNISTGITLFNSETEIKNNNSNVSSLEFQSLIQKFLYYCQFGNKSRKNGTSDESLEAETVDELLGIVNEIISTLNLSSSDNAISEMITEYRPCVWNVQDQELREKLMQSEFSQIAVTQGYENPQLPSRPKTNASHSYEIHTNQELMDSWTNSTNERLRKDDSPKNNTYPVTFGGGNKGKVNTFLKSLIDVIEESCNFSNVTNLSNDKNGSTSILVGEIEEDQILNAETKDDTSADSTPGQPSFDSEENISRTDRLIYRDEELGLRIDLPSYGAPYNGSNTHYAHYNSSYGYINISNTPT